MKIFMNQSQESLGKSSWISIAMLWLPLHFEGEGEILKKILVDFSIFGKHEISLKFQFKLSKQYAI
jgi:hypothetical protein